MRRGDQCALALIRLTAAERDTFSFYQQTMILQGVFDVRAEPRSSVGSWQTVFTASVPGVFGRCGRRNLGRSGRPSGLGPGRRRYGRAQQPDRCRHDRLDLDRMQDCFRTTDFRELLDRPDVDAVMITTPDHWHVPIALASIRAGKDVACEKPIGLCVQHGRILADAAAAAGCVFRTDSEFRSIPLWYKAVSLVRTGKIGQLKTIRTVAPCWNQPLPMQPTMPVPPELDYEMWLGPAPLAPYTEQRVHAPKSYVAGYDRPGWYGNRTYCDGGIVNWGYHPLDIVQWGNDSELTGPVEVEGTGEFPPLDGLWNVILGFDVRYRYANGVELVYKNTGRDASTPNQVHVRFEGTEGWVCCWYGPDRLEAEPESLLSAEVKPEDFPFPLENERRNFLNCIKTRARTLADAEVGHRSTTVAQIAYIACQVGRPLKWDPDAERFQNDDEANQLLTLPPGRPPWSVT